MLDSKYEPGWTDQRDRCNCDCNGSNPPGGQPCQEGCCSGSHLRDPGIKKTNTPGVYFADADLECSTVLCAGSDSDIGYEWKLYPVSGDAFIEGSSTKVGDNTVRVGGTGTFYLHVKVTFRCLTFSGGFAECLREAIVRFTQ